MFYFSVQSGWIGVAVVEKVTISAKEQINIAVLCLVAID